MNDEKKRKEVPQKKQIDYDYCGKHKIRYPKGAICPKCAVEKNK